MIDIINKQNINRTPTVSFCTLGCKVNQYESQAMAEDFERLGFLLSDFDKKCDIYVINTCTVTSESDKKSRQMIRRARKHGGDSAAVIAVGCFAQAQIDNLQKIKELTAAFGNDKKSKVAEFSYDLWKKMQSSENTLLPFTNKVTDISSVKLYDDMSITKSERTRAFVKIVDGCENKCSYCIIPSVRGKIRSRDPDKILDEIKILVSSGYKEIVLTGIETAAYGKDLNGYNLPYIIKQTDSIPGIERIRLGSLEPTVIDNEFIDMLVNTKHVVPHFHLSLQSGSNAVLRRMRRKYNTDIFFKKVSMIRSVINDATFTTDIIVGFPGETDYMFEETCDLVKKCGFLFVHIFPYSRRKGTEAADFEDQVPEYIKKHRANELKKIMFETRKKVFQSFDGKETSVLFEEKSDDGFYMGHTPQYIEAKLITASNRDISSEIHACRLIFDNSVTEYMRCTLI